MAWQEGYLACYDTQTRSSRFIFDRIARRFCFSVWGVYGTGGVEFQKLPCAVVNNQAFCLWIAPEQSAQMA